MSKLCSERAGHCCTRASAINSLNCVNSTYRLRLNTTSYPVVSIYVTNMMRFKTHYRGRVAPSSESSPVSDNATFCATRSWNKGSKKIQ